MQPPDSLDEVLGTVTAARGLGEIRTDAAWRVGHVPHVAPEAYLHTIFAPLGEADVARLASLIGRELPSSYASLLRISNGLLLFSESLSIFGLRGEKRRAISAVEQPFSAIVPNTSERPRGIPETAVVVGSYGQDGSRVVVDADGVTGRVDRRSGGTLNRWPSLQSMLSQEVARMSPLFDDNGRLLASRERCAPPPAPTLQ